MTGNQSPMSILRIADETAVLAANDAFYQALESLSVARMNAVWWHEDWVRCLHPGWDLLVGWKAIQGSFASIFQATAQMRVVLSRVLVHVVGDVAWVSCIEQVTSTIETDFSTVLVEATNLFVRRGGEWRLAHRHCTPMPALVTSGATNSVQ